MVTTLCPVRSRIAPYGRTLIRRSQMAKTHFIYIQIVIQRGNNSKMTQRLGYNSSVGREVSLAHTKPGA